MTDLAINMRGRLISIPKQNGSVEIAPFILARDDDKNIHVPCWLEWHDGEFDPASVLLSEQPVRSQYNSLNQYRSLPTLEVSIDGATLHTFRAVCDRSLGGEIGVIECDGGTLWTVLPKK